MFWWQNRKNSSWVQGTELVSLSDLRKKPSIQSFTLVDSQGILTAAQVCLVTRFSSYLFLSVQEIDTIHDSALALPLPSAFTCALQRNREKDALWYNIPSIKVPIVMKTLVNVDLLMPLFRTGLWAPGSGIVIMYQWCAHFLKSRGQTKGNLAHVLAPKRAVYHLLTSQGCSLVCFANHEGTLAHVLAPRRALQRMFFSNWATPLCTSLFCTMLVSIVFDRFYH